VNSSRGISERVRISAAIFEDLADRGSGFERAVAGELDDGAVGDGVGEGDAQLDEVGGRPRSRASTGAGVRFGRGIAGGDVGDEAFAAVALQSREEAGDAGFRHGLGIQLREVFAVDVDIFIAAARLD